MAHDITWVQFEIYSDHDSSKYLFTQKAPSQRILRLCQFLADYDFTEINYVPGPENVVPDFFTVIGTLNADVTYPHGGDWL